MNAGVKAATDLFITKFVLGKADWVTRLAVPFVVRNYSTHLLADKGKTFISRIATFLNNKKKYGIKEERRSPRYDAQTQGINGTVDHKFGTTGIEGTV
jgi:hypothetical protein